MGFKAKIFTITVLILLPRWWWGSWLPNRDVFLASDAGPHARKGQTRAGTRIFYGSLVKYHIPEYIRMSPKKLNEVASNPACISRRHCTLQPTSIFWATKMLPVSNWIKHKSVSLRVLYIEFHLHAYNTRVKFRSYPTWLIFWNLFKFIGTWNLTNSTSNDSAKHMRGFAVNLLIIVGTKKLFNVRTIP